MLAGVFLGVAVAVCVDVQVQLAQINPEDPTTYPNMGPQMEYFTIPVIFVYLAIPSLVATAIAEAASRRRFPIYRQWLYLGASYTLVLGAIPIARLGADLRVSAALCLMLAALSATCLWRRYSVKQYAA